MSSPPWVVEYPQIEPLGVVSHRMTQYCWPLSILMYHCQPYSMVLYRHQAPSADVSINGSLLSLALIDLWQPYIVAATILHCFRPDYHQTQPTVQQWLRPFAAIFSSSLPSLAALHHHRPATPNGVVSQLWGR